MSVPIPRTCMQGSAVQGSGFRVRVQGSALAAGLARAFSSLPRRRFSSASLNLAIAASRILSNVVALARAEPDVSAEETPSDRSQEQR